MKYPRYFIYVGRDLSSVLFTKILEPGGVQFDIFPSAERFDPWSRKEEAMLRWVKQGSWKEILVEEVALKFGRV